MHPSTSVGDLPPPTDDLRNPFLEIRNVQPNEEAIPLPNIHTGQTSQLYEQVIAESFRAPWDIDREQLAAERLERQRRNREVKNVELSPSGDVFPQKERKLVMKPPPDAQRYEVVEDEQIDVPVVPFHDPGETPQPSSLSARWELQGKSPVRRGKPLEHGVTQKEDILQLEELTPRELDNGGDLLYPGRERFVETPIFCTRCKVRMDDHCSNPKSCIYGMCVWQMYTCPYADVEGCHCPERVFIAEDNPDWSQMMEAEVFGALSQSEVATLRTLLHKYNLDLSLIHI